MGRELHEIPLGHVGYCPSCEKAIPDVERDPADGKWRRARPLVYCSAECRSEGQKPGGHSWMLRFCPNGFELLGMWAPKKRPAMSSGALKVHPDRDGAVSEGKATGK